MARPTIFYFDIRARAEPIRLIFEELGIGYDDRQVAPDEWPAMRDSTPFRQLPALRYGGEDGLEIYQSHAIYRHLARVHDLYGSSEVEHVRCDVVDEALADLNNLIGMAPWRDEFEKKRDDFVTDELIPRLGRLARWFEANESESGFWVGKSLTFVDLVAFAHLDCTRAMFPEAIEAHPVMERFADGIARRPHIAAYLASDRRPAAAQYGPRGKIYDRSL